jgi:hypothetical protein
LFRRQFEIVRFPEPTPPLADTDLQVDAEVFPVVFEDREGVNVESMVVQASGAIILVEKLEEPGRSARVWQIERPVRDRPNVPVEVATIPVTRASGADLSVDGNTMVVRNADTAVLYDLRRGVPRAFEQPVRQQTLPLQDQGEGVAFTMDGQGLVLSGEGRTQAVWFVPLTPGADPSFGPLEADVSNSARGDAAGRGRTPGAAVWTWIVDVGIVWSLPTISVLVLAFGVVVRSQRRAGRSRG